MTHTFGSLDFYICTCVGVKSFSDLRQLPEQNIAGHKISLWYIVPEMNRSKWKDQDPNLMKLSWLLGKRTNNFNVVPEAIRRR